MIKLWPSGFTHQLTAHQRNSEKEERSDFVAMDEPLLQNEGLEAVYVKKTSLFVSSVKWVLKFLMWVLFIAWIALIFVYPSEFGTQLFEKWIQATTGTVFGVTGSIFLVFSGPVLVIAFLSIVHLIISGEEDLPRKKTSKYPRFRLWTFPMLVDGPFGVVSAAEFVGIVLFVVFVIWAVYAYTMTNISLLSKFQIPSKEKRYHILSFIGQFYCPIC
ncbi:hypothetical protein Patl1_16750 [Pistacia atlantica]|uniref:Uncharacterized protein n=1 Tax=Pistacia atlantica TaxID=434234 RepID=A0ACC1B5M4_9ROSI|nr:hypothetical protein Patl1_16750 [Pistacia atlantica]